MNPTIPVPYPMRLRDGKRRWRYLVAIEVESDSRIWYSDALGNAWQSDNPVDVATLEGCIAGVWQSIT